MAQGRSPAGQIKHGPPRAGGGGKRTPFRQAGTKPAVKDRPAAPKANDQGLPGPLAAATRLVVKLIADTGPADRIVSGFFKDHAELGRRDRGLIAEIAFMVLRRKARFVLLAGKADEDQPLGAHALARRLVLQAVVALGHGVPRGMHPDETVWFDRLPAHDQPLPDSFPVEARWHVPGWLAQRWQDVLGDETAQLVQALDRPAPLDLRVNAVLAETAVVRQALADAGIPCEDIGGLPGALRVQGKPALTQTDAFSKGWIEVQDVGSQWIARLLGVKRGETVVDFCAGAGGKTLALGAQMRNRGRIYALDTSTARLQRLKPRLARSGLSNVWPIAIEHERDSRLKRLIGKVDRVLVDAPCTGSGTLRRQPEIKWRLVPEDVSRLAQQQASILAAAARLVKPGGRLVYATCSLIAEENQQLVDAFLADNPDFEPDTIEPGLLEWAGDSALIGDGMVQLWPQRHDTDGFFAAVLRRRDPVGDARKAEAAALALARAQALEQGWEPDFEGQEPQDGDDDADGVDAEDVDLELGADAGIAVDQPADDVADGVSDDVSDESAGTMSDDATPAPATSADNPGAR